MDKFTRYSWWFILIGAILAIIWALVRREMVEARVACSLLFINVFAVPTTFHIPGWRRFALEAIGLTGFLVLFAGEVSHFTVGLPLAFLLATHVAAFVLAIAAMLSAIIIGLAINVVRRLSSRWKNS